MLRQSIRLFLQADGNPHDLALAFAVGVFFGFSPLLGLHTVLGLAAAVLFRLNKLAVLAGVYSNNPWIIGPFYVGATWLGLQLTGLPEGTALPSFGLTKIFQADFWLGLAAQWRLLIPTFVGSTILCSIFAVLSYPLALWTIRKFKPESRAPQSGEAAEGSK